MSTELTKLNLKPIGVAKDMNVYGKVIGNNDNTYVLLKNANKRISAKKIRTDKSGKFFYGTSGAKIRLQEIEVF